MATLAVEIGTLEAVEAAFARLGPDATINRQSRGGGRPLWTIHTSCAGSRAIGQGATLLDAMRDLHEAGRARA